MDGSTGARVDLESLRHRVGATRDEVAAFDSPSESERARHRATALSQLDAMDLALVTQLGRLEVELPRIACPFCGHMIMSNATLCGFCWRRQASKTG
jgi:hypothetical protein